ncbi:hypothetical protein K435DRAFT_649227 [Dendrothele bispora CBS 962.96]|uniref:Sensitive to high expression protein 9, mitochondrial n=1 Tax=Dendrothele bispora (strain CBS 962.96) TaxID=1314807 RepID=A0A4S8MND4_DENBC|nr:hypothetical protein K435DRAFT_649227 [Dendrothele bispora CBS 962.96]
MLRASLRSTARRPPRALRQFSSTPLTWNTSSSSSGDAKQNDKVKSGDSNTVESDSVGRLSESSSTSTSSSASSSSAPSSSSTSSSSSSSSPPPQPYDLATLKNNFAKLTDEAAIKFRKRADDFTASTKITFSQLGAQLNKVTGYEEIEALKLQVVEQETRINQSRQAAREAKLRYEKAVEQRSNSQREVNDLLQRKSSWTDYDVSRFTTLVREDHHFEQEETRAKVAVDEAEAAVEKEFTELTRSILARYHEEQVWSDKIRSASTYGQLAVLGLNLAVFVLAIVLVEPWKRKRLAQTFEKKIEEMEGEYREVVGENVQRLQQQLADQTKVLVALGEAVAKVEAVTQIANEEVVEEKDEPPLTTEGWSKAVRDRHFGEAVATGAVAASIIGALGWIFLGG